ncbi:MAG: (deoxy)nucleoside triphosphate pyrophosphohydrolase [Candidatus Bathyarchaeia archaeon]
MEEDPLILCSKPNRKVVVCTAAIVISNGRLLLAQRGAGSTFGLMWELPGGKSEPSESMAECLRRELYEELGVEAEVGKLYSVASMNLDGERLIMFCYFCRLLNQNIRLQDHIDYAWVSKEDLPNYNLAPLDSIIVEQIKHLPQMR